MLIAITGTDDEGFFTAANAYSIDEFMHGNSDFLYYKTCNEDYLKNRKHCVNNVSQVSVQKFV